MIEIKECPFCGHKANAVKGFDFLGNIMYQIICEVCGAHTKCQGAGKGFFTVINGAMKNYTITDKEAIEKLVNIWNSRTDT